MLWTTPYSGPCGLCVVTSIVQSSTLTLNPYEFATDALNSHLSVFFFCNEYFFNFKRYIFKIAWELLPLLQEVQ